jgi:hypothetical protein
MARFKIAHIREQGIDLIIVPLDSSFGDKSKADQEDAVATLQDCAAAEGLAGSVVPVWRSGDDYQFIVPGNWHAFFKSLSWNIIMRNLNGELTCDELVQYQRV